MKIWLIGGTSESVTVAQILLTHNFSVVVTVATESAIKLYGSHPNLMVVSGKIAPEDMKSFVLQHQVKVIIDASHPFAVNVSQGAMISSQKYHIPYLRYDRPSIPTHDQVIEFSSYESLLDSQYLRGKRVLLTVGCQPLSFFENYHQESTLFTRVLPYPDSLNQAYQAGFKCDRIIALRPPINYQLEKALWQNWDIETVVTKAGGKAGGQNIKQKLAQELNIPLVVISRPTLDYLNLTSKMSDILEFCFKHFHH